MTRVKEIFTIHTKHIHTNAQMHTCMNCSLTTIKLAYALYLLKQILIYPKTAV